MKTYLLTKSTWIHLDEKLILQMLVAALAENNKL